jgi:hypothetical protein
MCGIFHGAALDIKSGLSQHWLLMQRRSPMSNHSRDYQCNTSKDPTDKMHEPLFVLMDSKTLHRAKPCTYKPAEGNWKMPERVQLTVFFCPAGILASWVKSTNDNLWGKP